MLRLLVCSSALTQMLRGGSSPKPDSSLSLTAPSTGLPRPPARASIVEVLTVATAIAIYIILIIDVKQL
jgi:hypothetical protein